MKLLIIVRKLAYEAVHSTQKIVYIRLCLYIIQVYEQYVNHRELPANVHELGGNFFAKYRICTRTFHLMCIVMKNSMIATMFSHEWTSYYNYV